MVRLVSTVFFTIFIVSYTFATVYKSPNLDTAEYWSKYNENRLQKLTKQLFDHDVATTAKNIIIFIGDGMGIQTITAARIFKGQLGTRSGEEEQLSWEDFSNTGLVKTYNVDTQVTDSAAGATAIFCGSKTNTGWIGVDRDGKPLDSIMSLAQKSGKKTGFVTTTRVTHATPAGLYAHTKNRVHESDSYPPKPPRTGAKRLQNDAPTESIDIARQLVENYPGKGFDVVMGGGRIALGDEDCNPPIVPKEFIVADDYLLSARLDGQNLTKKWLKHKRVQGKKVVYVRNKYELEKVNAKKVDSVLGLFANDHVSYFALRNYTNEPSLAEMVTKAIEVLKNGNQGFVLMVESGRIDLAHHLNMAKLALYETVALEQAVDAALKLTGNDTLILVTADHSHAMTFNGYPSRGNDITGIADPKVNLETLTYANGPSHLQHSDGNSIGSGRERKHLVTMDGNLLTYQHFSPMYLKYETHGGEDVAIYANGPGSELVRGTMEQNFISHIIGFAGCFGPASHSNPNCQCCPSQSKS